VRGGLRLHDLDERQDRGGIEEVHADHALGRSVAAAISRTGNGEVFVQNGLGKQPSSSGEDLALRVELLDRQPR
jgi:hypothetical protein